MLFEKSFAKISLIVFICTVPCDAHYFEKIPSYGPLASFVYSPGHLSVQAQYFSRKETVSYFGVDLVARGYRPLLITLFNINNRDYILQKDSFKLPLVSTKRIIKLMQANTLSFAAGAVVRFIRFINPGLLNVTGVSAAMVHNWFIAKNMEQYRLRKNQTYVIAPYTQLTFFLFVKEEEFVQQFEVCYADTLTKNYETITVDLLKQVADKYVLPDGFIID